MTVRAACFGATAVWLAAMLPGMAGEQLVGVGITNISWQQKDVIGQTLADIDAARFNAVRIAWKGSLERARFALADATALGLQTLLVLPLTDGPVSLEGAQARPKTGDFFAVNGLSQLDSARFGAQVADLLDYVRDERIDLAGIELANEMNWSAFNGDLPLAAQGRVISALEGFDPAGREIFERGLDAYVEALGIVNTALDERGLDIPVVLGALADVDAEFARSSGATLVAPDLVRTMLMHRGAYEMVDAIGRHLYAPLELDLPVQHRADGIAEALAACGTEALARRPCWLTEYGVAAWRDLCDVTDADRKLAFEPLLDYLTRPETAVTVPASFFYDWSESREFSLVRCGTLSALAADITSGAAP